MESFEEELKRIKQELENKGSEPQNAQPENGEPPAENTPGVNTDNAIPSEGGGEGGNTQQPNTKPIDLQAELADIKEKLRQSEELAEKLKGYISNMVDPLSLFSSERVYKAEQLRKQNPSIPHDIAYEVVEDVDKLDPVKAIAYTMLIEEPNLEGGIEGAVEQVMSKYELDNLDDIPRVIKNKLLLEAKQAKESLKKLVGSIPEFKRPEPIDEIVNKYTSYSGKVKELEARWENSFDNIKPLVGEIRITPKDGSEPFVFKVEDDFINEVKSSLSKIMATYQLDPETDDGKRVAEKEVKTAYLAEKFEQLAEAYASYRVSKAVEAIKREYAGMEVKKPNTGSPAKVDGNPTVEEIISRSKKYF